MHYHPFFLFSICSMMRSRGKWPLSYLCGHLYRQGLTRKELRLASGLRFKKLASTESRSMKNRPRRRVNANEALTKR
jgi:hypothetical protein